MTMTFAVVAPGAMGAAIGARLSEHEARVVTSLAGRSEASRERAAASGMADASDDAVARADLILSVVPPNEALPLAGRLASAIARAGTRPLYLDLNAINPATAREVGAALANSGARYVDGSIIGMPPKPAGRGPTFYLSGEVGNAADALNEHGLWAEILSGGIGAASALKMSYAGITKGLTALAAAMIAGARREGADAALAAELARSQPDLLARFARAIPDMLPKAYRWEPEMEEIAAFLRPDDPASGIYAAMARFYRRIADDRAADGALAGELTAFFAAAKSPPG